MTSRFLLLPCFTFYLFSTISCTEKDVEFQSNDCRSQSAFIKKVGFDPARSALSTSESKKMGLWLLQFNATGDTSNGGRKMYQHPSWKSAGWLGPLQIDPLGNCFVAPIPVINLIDNPPAKQNIIYRVDATSGIMSPFVNLPVPEKISPTNPYGIVGFAYLCESNILYAATILGSTRVKENGCIYAIEANTGKIIDKVSEVDALGLGISFVEGKRKLYVGSARTSEVFSININKDGSFKGRPSLELSIAELGPRGDDKARKIRFDKNGNMQVFAIEFNYNLTAPTEKQEALYMFSWSEEDKKWVISK